MRLLPSFLAACLAAAVAVPAAAAPPVPLLWKVSDGDNGNVVYLLGSFHMLKPTDYPLSQDVDAAVADAEAMLFEITPDELASPAVATGMMRAGLRTDGSTLDEEIGPALAARLAAWAAAQPEGSPMTAAVLQRFEPWFAGLTVSILQMTAMGLDPALGLDRHFMAVAEAQGKPVAGLETAAQQIALFDGMDPDEQVQMLADALDQAAAGPDALEDLHADWRAGDVDALWDGMAADMRMAFPALYRRINVERNQAWLPKLAARLEAPGDDDTLVVVGALHLLGEDGVVEGLRERGYTVERICSACEGR
ncbi:MAG TPA: TraB/GumN family protein [Xanthomonadaceae bacterium]|nr:TraB/GumN family protein [Xanthomonadaceae bacterium]